MPVEGEFPMKFDISTKHFICKKCGLYATREQISDIKDRLNRRESTREDRQYDYLDWWQKNIKPTDLERGVVYEFTFESLKAPLSKKVVEFLKKEKEIDMDAVYQFNLK